MREFINNISNTFIPLFVAIDIFLVLPIFVSLTHGMDRRHKSRAVRQSVLTAFLVSLIFISVGKAIFSLLGITVHDFKVAGGVLLLVMAINDITRAEGKNKYIVSDTLGVVPVGVPLIVGPAVLTTILVLVEQYGLLFTIVSMFLNLALVYVALVNANKVVKVLGSGGVVALSKIMAILLGSIAVMMIRIGLQAIIG